MAKKTSEFPVVGTVADGDTLTGIAGNLDINVTIAALKTKILALQDAGGFYTSDNVEAALQQIGLALFTNLPANYQPKDDDLTAIAALTTTPFGRGLLTLTNVAAASTLLGFQPLDSDLTSIAALTTTAFGLQFLTRADAAASRTYISAQLAHQNLTDIAGVTLSTFGKGFLSLVDAPASRTYIGAAPTADPTFTGNVVVPTADAATEAVNKAQMDAADLLKVDKATLTTDGDIFTRSGGVVTRMTRASLASDAAFTAAYQPFGTPGPQGATGPIGPPGPTGPRRGVKNDTTTAYAPILSDENMMVTLSNAAAITITLPSDITQPFEIGSEIDFLWLGVGQPTFAAGAGATVNATPGLKLRARYAAAAAKKIAANTWVVMGDLNV